VSPFLFKPIYVERPWGGRKIGRLFGRDLPEDKKIGESWELVDRPEACNEIVSGPGIAIGSHETLHTLWVTRRAEVFGSGSPDTARFPILIKILDAQANVCVQVHPRPGPGVEPKTEMWYFLEAAATPIYAGFKKGVTRERFEKALRTPELVPLLHELRPRDGDALFLPSGRIHGLCAGHVFFEVQQNSDTTYRIDDWGYRDEQGRERPLHLEESMKSIFFDDFEPRFVESDGEHILDCPFFAVDRLFLKPGESQKRTGDSSGFEYHFLARGELKLDGRAFQRCDNWLIPASAGSYTLEALGNGAELLVIRWGGKA
jgi:mannose-6-phosphate isomerase